jgi:hypothetical protein
MPNINLNGRFDDLGNFMGMVGEGGATVSRSNQIERAIERYRAKHRKGTSRACLPGDSYALGNGASVAANSYYGKLKAALAGQFAFSNYGVGGQPMVAYLRQASNDGADVSNFKSWQVLADDLFPIMMGLNDLRGSNTACGSNPVNLAQMSARAQAVATWLMVPEAAKVRMHTVGDAGANPAVTFAGTWNHGGFGGDPMMSYSTTAGATASFTTPKGNLLVIWTAVDVASTNQCTVTVDGVQVSAWSTAAAYDNWSLSCHIVPLTTNQAHNVVLTQVGAGNMMSSAAACVDTTQDFGATLIYSPPGYLTDAAAAGWSDAGGALNGATAQALGTAGPYVLNNAGSDRFAVAMWDAMDQLFNLGFNVAYVPARAGFIPAQHIAADKVHPNDLGHDHIFKAFNGVMSRMAGL